MWSAIISFVLNIAQKLLGNSGPSDDGANDRGGYQVVLKATKIGEVFVETFHRIHLREARRLARKALKDGKFIRAQVGFEGLLKSKK